jgi:hypothetical protein
MNGRRRGMSTSACDSTRELEKTRPPDLQPARRTDSVRRLPDDGLDPSPVEDQFTEVFALSRGR